MCTCKFGDDWENVFHWVSVAIEEEVHEEHDEDEDWTLVIFF